MKTIKHNGLEWTDFSSEPMNYDEAKEYAESLGFRLPTREEIKTLSKDGNYPYKDRLEELGFNFKPWTWCEEYITGYAWTVYFNYGIDSNNVKTDYNYVVCVRDENE